MKYSHYTNDILFEAATFRHVFYLKLLFIGLCSLLIFFIVAFFTGNKRLFLEYFEAFYRKNHVFVLSLSIIASREILTVMNKLLRYCTFMLNP